MKTMTKLSNLGRISVKANIAKLCYAVAKTMIKLNNQTIVPVETNLP